MSDIQAKPEWKDSTSYSRDEPYPREPRSWSLWLGPVKVVVTCGHIYHRGKWVMVCPQLDLGTSEHPHKLQAATAAEAQAEALDLAAAHVRQLVAALDWTRQEREL